MKTLVFSALASCLLALHANAINIPTSKYNNLRTGANLSETTLKPSNVNVNQFGKLFERVVDGELYCQPLIVEGLNIGGKTRNVVFLVTVKNVAYAFDAEDPNASTPLWVRNFGNPVPASDVQPCCTDYSTWVGTAGTPAIDVANKIMYFVTKQKDADGTYHHRLRKVDILTGNEMSGSGLDMTAVNSGVTFDAKLQNQRSAILLQGGKLYIASGGHNDAGAYEGWILVHDAANLALTGSWLVTPNGVRGGIWMSGGGPVGDGSNIYFTTGNGDFNASSGGNNYSECFVGLSSSLSVLSWFAPANWNNLNGQDLDLGGAGVMMIPNTRLLVSGGKDGKLYLVNADNMGGFTSGRDACLQSFAVGGRHIHGGPVHWKTATAEYVYVGPEEDELKCFALQNGLFNTTPVWQSAMAAPLGMPGWQASVSANGTSDGIVWATLPWSGDAAMQVQPGVMRAFNALTGAELYNTRQNATRDNFGNFAKNPSPVVNNGRVYVPTFSDKLVVYGLLPANSGPPAPTGLTATAGNQQVTLNWNASDGATSYNVKRSTTSGGSYSTIATGVTTTSYTNTGLVNGTTYYYVVSAVNANGESPNSNEASATPGTGEYSYWAFNESSGTTASDSWGTRHGTLVNGPTWVAGKKNNAVNLDGSNDYVSFPSGLVSTLNDFTIATWVYYRSNTGWQRIFDYGSGTSTFMFLTPKSGAGNRLRFAIKLNGGSEQQINAASLSLNTWHHVAVTLSGGVGILYVNGVEVARNSSMTLKPSDLGSTSQNWIGRSQYSADPYLNGMIDDFRIYSRALSASEIATLAQ